MNDNIVKLCCNNIKVVFIGEVIILMNTVPIAAYNYIIECNKLFIKCVYSALK